MMKQRERDIVRDIKLALKNDETDTIKVLLAEYKALAPSRPDVLYDVAHSLLAKDRPTAEKAFSYIAQRGSVGGSSGDLTYASALVQLSVLRYIGGAVQDAHKTLSVAVRFIADRRAAQGKHDPSVQEKLDILYDYTNHFLAMCCYRLGQWAEVLRWFDETSSYHVVLQPANYALITLVKALAFLKLGNKTDALGALHRRQSQEEALQQVSLIATSGTDVIPVSNSNAGKNPRKGSLSSVHLCHDLHIALLNATGQTEEARDYFKQFKQDYQRADFDSFIALNTPVESIGNHLVDWWTPTFPDLNKNRVQQ